MVVDKVTNGEWNDFEKLVQFSEDVACATSEFENIPSKTFLMASSGYHHLISFGEFHCQQHF